MDFVFSQLAHFGVAFWHYRLLKHNQTLYQMWEEYSLKQNLITISSKNVCILGKKKYVRITERDETWTWSLKSAALTSLGAHLVNLCLLVIFPEIRLLGREHCTKCLVLGS